jgi:hypothetical protein
MGSWSFYPLPSPYLWGHIWYFLVIILLYVAMLCKAILCVLLDGLDIFMWWEECYGIFLNGYILNVKSSSWCQNNQCLLFYCLQVLMKDVLQMEHWT